MRQLPIMFAITLMLADFSTVALSQVSETDAYQAQSAILSAGSRAPAVSRLRVVPSVGVIRLRMRTMPTMRSNAPDPAEFEISAAKNMGGIKKLRNALAANPVTRNILAHRGIAVGRVVGISIYSNGSVRFYIL